MAEKHDEIGGNEQILGLQTDLCKGKAYSSRFFNDLTYFFFES